MPLPQLGGARGIMFSCVRPCMCLCVRASMCACAAVRASVYNVVSTISVVYIDGFSPNFSLWCTLA